MNIREIARLAGVSVATVSRSINQPEKVSPETRERIMAVIQQTDYVPNPSAQSLSTGQTRTIACIVPTLRNEFFNQLVEGSQKVLGNAGYKLLIYSTNNDHRCVDKLDQRGIDGIIISGSDFTRDIKEYLLHLRVPYVIIENVEQLRLKPQPVSVYIEDYDGVQMALRYLYAEGNRSFGVVAGRDQTLITERRMQAVTDFFEQHRDCVCRVVRADYAVPEQSSRAVLEFLNGRERPTAIFAFNDMMAAGVLRSLLEQGVRVPEEMEVMGFDDIPLASYFTPSLSTISAPNRRLGEKAAELLLRQLKEGVELSTCILYPVELRLRESTKNRVDSADFV